MAYSQIEPGLEEYIHPKSRFFQFVNTSPRSIYQGHNQFARARFNWQLNPSQREISGSIEYKLKDPTAELILDCSNVLQIDSILSPSGSLSYFQTNGNQLRIIDQHTFKELIIYYHGNPISSGLGSFTTSEHQSGPILWTLSEPYGSKDWWPAPTNLNHKIDTTEFFITCPKGYTAVTNGLLLDSTSNGTRTTFHWLHQYPIAPYLIAVAVSNFEEYSHKIWTGRDSLLIQNFLYPNNYSNYETIETEIPHIFSLFDSLFGVYPFQNEKYGHTQFNWSGGMEHQTNSFMSTFGFELTAHELAHQWFGNKITCGSWSELWLNEGFATYATTLCYEHLLFGEYKTRSKQVLKEKVLEDSTGSVFTNDTTNISRLFSGRLTYQKGAMVLHALRNYIGDKAFFKAIKSYLSDSSLLYNYAQTEDLIDHFQKETSEDMHEFFSSWIFSQGFPHFDIKFQNDDYSSNIQLLQTNRLAGDTTFFPCQVNLKINDSILPIPIHEKKTTLYFNQVIENLVFDPEYDLIATSEISPYEFYHRELELVNNIGKEEILLKSNMNTPSYSKIVITSLTGAIVKEIPMANLNNNYSISIAALKRGTYLLYGVDKRGKTKGKKFSKI